MKKIASATILISFVLAWGIVGKIDHGGDLILALWLIPLLALFWVSTLILERK